MREPILNYISKMPLSSHHQNLQDLLKQAKGPLSADEIRELLGRRSIAQATVYRLLKQGLEEGRFHEVAFPNSPNRYELSGQPHHHHFLCHSCDRAFDIKGCPKQISALAPEGFQLDGHEILLRGRCPECTQVVA